MEKHSHPMDHADHRPVLFHRTSPPRGPRPPRPPRPPRRRPRPRRPRPRPPGPPAPLMLLDPRHLVVHAMLWWPGRDTWHQKNDQMKKPYRSR